MSPIAKDIASRQARNLGPDGGQGRRLHLRGRLGRHARRHLAGAEGTQFEGEDRARRSDGRGALFLVHGGRTEILRSSITEGIGQGASPKSGRASRSTSAYQISDEEAPAICFDLAEHEGLLLGVIGRERRRRHPARPDLGPGHTIVTVLCDSGVRYAAKMFNPEFLRSKDLPVPAWMERVRQ